MQKAGALACCIIVIAGLVFGILTKRSFTDLTAAQENILNASVMIDQAAVDDMDERYFYLDFETALFEFEYRSYIFEIQCVSSEICYDCIKHTVTVTKTLKGSVDETGNTIVLYQWGGFEKADTGELVFTSYDNSLPLKAGCTYLVCADKRAYCDAYQAKLAGGEYSLGLTGNAPAAYIVSDVQSGYIHTDTVQTYSDIQDFYYMCFSQKALDNINSVTEKMIAYYLTDDQ